MDTSALLNSAICSLALLYLNDWQCFGLLELNVTFIVYFISRSDVKFFKACKQKYVQFLLEKWQKRRVPFVTKPNAFGHSTREIGNFPCDNDFLVEHRTNANESLNLLMVDESGSWMHLRIMYLNSSSAKVDFLWFDKGVLYQLPNEKSDIYDTEKCQGDTFKVAGFTLTVLEPLRRWRVLFNGILRNNSSQEMQHFKMNLIWSPLSSPFDWSSDVNYGPFSNFVVDSQLDLNQGSLEILRQNIHNHGFDQWGAIFGTIIQDESESEVYYRGLRQRYSKPQTTTNFQLEQKITITGITDHGFHFTINQHHIKDHKTVYNNGHLLIPGCALYPLSQIDCSDLTWIFDLSKRKDFYSHQVFVRFEAGQRWFNVGIQLSHVKTDFIKAEVTFNCHRGYASIHRQCPDLEQLASISKPMSNKVQDNGKWVLPLASLEATLEGVSGGKGASLAQMIAMTLQDKVEIPQGLVLTIHAFQNHLDFNPDLKDLLNNLQELVNTLCAEQNEDKRNILQTKLQASCSDVVDAFGRSQINPDLIKQLYASGFEDHLRFAIRSSALGEDSEDLSSAGQNETILGCKGLESTLKAIRKCWGSLFAYQSVEYRRQNGEAVVTSMAVVVQEMVDAEMAGVLFSRHPVTGNPMEIVITANFGLGESVVSAKAEPDQIVIANYPGSDLKIKNSQTGSKLFKVVMTDNETIEQVLDEDDSAKLCLNEIMALKLASLAVQLEHEFKGPRDIEFAIKQDTIFLLQSRPITSLASWTDYELEHEFDTATSSKLDISSKGNVGEVVPGATTVLSNFITLNALDAGIAMGMQMIAGNKQAYVPVRRNYLQVASHHILFNHQDLLLQAIETNEMKPELMAVDLSVYGHQVTKQSHLNTAIERRGTIPLHYRILRYMHVFKVFLQGQWMFKKGLSKRALRPFFNPLKFDQMTIEELFEDITEKAGYEYVHSLRNHLIASEASSTLCIITFLIAANNDKEWDADFCCDLAELMVSSSDQDVVSAGVPTELRNLAMHIFNCPNHQEFLTENAENWLKNQPQISEKYQQFLQNYGHRCLREFDLISKPWAEDSGPLIATLKSIVLTLKTKTEMAGPSAITFKNLTLDERLNQFKKPLTDGARKGLKFVLPLVYKAVALRETCKSMIIKRSHELRLAYRALAQKLCLDNGRLPHPDLIYHLSHFEIGQLLQKRNPTLIQKAIKRQKLRQSIWDQLAFPEINYGVPKPLTSNQTVVLSGNGISGTPVCRGKYQGPARIITKLSDASSIQRGDILITISTDIGWSPYFPLLGGVVTELGGLISHGAVVAREYGLPCVVGAEGATKAFETGDIVIIDGGKGSVIKIEQ